MRRCTKCTLPETFPGVQFHENGICNYCIYNDLFAVRLAKFKQELRSAFETAVKRAREQTSDGGNDCIVCYSGGKDSTFLLHVLKNEYGMQPLAFTFDNGFLSPQAHENIRQVVTRLNVDHIYLRPRFDMLKRMYREALTDRDMYASSILAYSNPCCLSCIAMVISGALKMGREKGIRIVVIGFTPYQAAEVGVESFLKTGSTLFTSKEVGRDDPVDFPKLIRDPLFERIGPEVDNFLLPSQYLSEGEAEYPCVLYPYHAMVEYDEQAIYDTIGQYGWVAPTDTDTCSTNCRMNSVSVISQLRQRGYHPYIGETSHLVRSGSLSRQEAMARENQLPQAEVIEDVLSKLDLQPVDIGFKSNQDFLDELRQQTTDECRIEEGLSLSSDAVSSVNTATTATEEGSSFSRAASDSGE